MERIEIQTASPPPYGFFTATAGLPAWFRARYPKANSRRPQQFFRDARNYSRDADRGLSMTGVRKIRAVVRPCWKSVHRESGWDDARWTAGLADLLSQEEN